MESTRTPYCEDPPATFHTFFGSALFDDDMERSLKEQLLLDREVLVHGVPCPFEELGKTIEAYWLAYTPWEKIVLCQIRIAEEDRILEVKEESWDGTLLFYEEMPLPLKNGHGPPLTWEDIKEKEDHYCSGKITQEEFLQWITNQLQNENTVDTYQDLLLMYWRTRRRGHSFTPEYIEGKNKSGKVPEELVKLIESVTKREEERKKNISKAETEMDKEFTIKD